MKKHLKLVTAPDLFEGESADLDDLIDTFRTNALEDYHAGTLQRRTDELHDHAWACNSNMPNLPICNICQNGWASGNVR